MKIKNKQFIYVGLFLLIAFTLSNQYLAINLLKNLLPDAHAISLTGNPETDAQILVFTQGTPKIYGDELGIIYEFDLTDQNFMNQMIAKMETFDRGSQKIEVDSLPSDIKKRYVDMGGKIACEFCCSAKTLVFNNGEAACGCAHSAAMRGLALYLLKNHPDEFSDDEILQELARWKALFFPKQMMKKYIEQTESGQYSPDIAALLLNTKVGKNSSNVTIPLPSNIENLPNMAGGC